MSQRYGLDGGLFSFGVKSVLVVPLVGTSGGKHGLPVFEASPTLDTH